MALRRLFPLAGIVFVALIVAVVLISGDTPTTDDSGQEVLDFYADHGTREQVLVFFFAAAIPFLVLFAGTLVDRTSAARSEGWSLARYFFLSGTVLLSAMLLVVAAIHFAIADAGDQGASPEAMEALVAVDGDLWPAFNAAFGVMMLGAAAVVLQRAPLPKWMGIAAAILGVALFIPYADFVALLLGLVWIIVASILLYVAKEPAPATT